MGAAIFSEFEDCEPYVSCLELKCKPTMHGIEFLKVLRTSISEFQVFNLKCTELILIMKALMIEGEKNKSGKPFRFKGVPNMTT